MAHARPPRLPAPQRLRRWYGLGSLGAAFLLAVSGTIGPAKPPATGVIYVLCLAPAAAQLWFSRRQSHDPRFTFTLAALTVLLFHLPARIDGAIDSPWRLGYLLAAPFLAFGPRTMLTGLGCIAVGMAADASLLAAVPEPFRLRPLLSWLILFAALAAVTAVTARLCRRRYAWAMDLRRELKELKDTAVSMVEFDRTVAPVEGTLSQDVRNHHWMGAAMRLDERLDSVLELAGRSLGADRCGLFIMDDSGDWMVARRIHPAPAGTAASAKLLLSGSLLGSVVKTSNPVLFGALDPTDERSAVLEPGRGARSLAAAPVESLGVVIGVLAAESARTDAFRDKRELLMGFSRQISDLLVASHRVVRKEEEGRIHQALSAISTAVSSNLKEKDILRTLLEKTSAMIGSSVAAYFTARGKNRVRLSQAVGLPDGSVGTVYSIQRCLLGYLFAHKRPLLFDDLADGRRKIPVVTGLPLDCRSLLAVPAVQDDEIVGVYLAADDNPGAFDRTHLDTLTILVNQAAVQLANATLHERMEAMAVTDGLTGLYNHRFFHERVEQEFQRLKRHSEPLSLIILDLDHFKRINDSYGHPFGDAVLKGTADFLKSLTREVDIVSRYGGEEMALLLIGTGRRGAETMAHRILKGLRQKRYHGPGIEVSVTASLGSATYPEDGSSPVELIRAADEALYRSKNDGRDRYTAAASPVLRP